MSKRVSRRPRQRVARASAPRPRVIAWAVGDRSHERFLSRALGRALQLVFCRTEPALIDEIARGGNAIVLVELADPGVQPGAPVIEGIKLRFPAVPVVGFCWLGPAASADIVASARAGLDALVLLGYDDLLKVVRRVLAQDIGDDAVVLHELHDVLPSVLMPWAHVVLERAREGPNVSVVARALGCVPRTMQRLAQAHAVARPSELVVCVRLLYAARLLVSRHLAVDEAALRVGFPSATALRRAFRRYGLMPPAKLRTPTGYAVVRHCLTQHMRGLEVASPAATAERARPTTDGEATPASPALPTSRRASA